MRVFVALPLPDDFKTALLAGAAPLEAARANLRRVPIENLHLTIAFLGEIDAASVPLVCEASRLAADTSGPFVLGAAGLIALPRPSRARIVAARIDDGAAACAALAARFEDALARGAEKSGVRFRERERRPFTAHVTLARLRAPARLDPSLLGTLPPACGSADGIAVYESETGPSGARYRILRFFPFSRR